MAMLPQAERNAAAGSGAAPQGGFSALVPEFDVTNIETSLRFWCGLLGFSVAYDRPAAKFAYLEREGAQVLLCEINGAWSVGPLQAPFGRGVNVQIMTGSLEPILIALEAARWPLFREVRDAWYRVGASEEAGAREFLVQDPDGYLLRFAQSLGRRAAGGMAVSRALVLRRDHLSSTQGATWA